MHPLLFLSKPCPMRLPRHTCLTIGRGCKGVHGQIHHGEQEQGDDGHIPGRHRDTGLRGHTAQGFGSALFFYFLKQE